MDNLALRTHNPLQQAQIYTDFVGLDKLRGEAKTNNSEALKQIAGQFESIFIGIALKSMRSANEAFAKDNPFNSQESRLYRDMLDNQLSLTLTQGKGIGLATTIVKQLSAYLPENQKSAALPKVDISL